MFKRLFVATCLLGVAVVSAAGPISDFDIGTYALTRADGQPTGMQIRVSRISGKWVMEGKEGDAPWKNISCDTGCDYRALSRAEASQVLAAFPREMQNSFEIACIKNAANAFCRLTKKENPSQGGYAFVALITGKPTPMSLQRLTRPDPSNSSLQRDASPQSGSRP